MRRPDKAWNEADALALLKRADGVSLGGALADGTPVLRTLHPAFVGDRLFFHGSPKGERNGLLGRPVQLGAHELIAEIPSYASDPERACPATTFYRAALARGVVREVEDADLRAAALQALMARFQPEGGHRPITAGDPMYRGSLRALAIWEVAELVVEGKLAAGQQKPPAWRGPALEALWRRGRPGDPAAIEEIVEAAPPDPWPAFLVAPGGRRIRLALRDDDREDALALLRDQPWNAGIADERLWEAQRGALAWVGIAEGDRLVATARAIGDRAKLAYVMDVAVAADRRGLGLGRALIAALLDHPAVRGCRRVELHTRTAPGFYAGFGFVPVEDPAGRVAMRWERG